MIFMVTGPWLLFFFSTNCNTNATVSSRPNETDFCTTNVGAFLLLQTHFYTHRLRLAKPRSPSKFSMLKSCKLLCENTFFSHTKGFSLRVDWDKSVCGEINWFPFLVCRVEGILQEEGAGTGKVGEEINWSHYVTLCVICFGRAPKTPSSIHGWG